MLKLKCAIIGCGGLGKSHLSNVVTMEDVEIVALCDVDEEQFTKATNTNLGAGATIDVSNFNLYTQAEEMLEKEELDFVIIALPTFLHEKYAVMALNKGLHVFCEKPMARTVEACQNMIDAAKRNNKLLSIGQCLRFDYAYSMIKEAYESGKYGKLLRLDLTRYSYAPIWAWENWYMNFERSGGAALDLHVHDVDFINYLLGRPDAVKSNAIHKTSGFDCICTEYFYKDGPIVHAIGDWSLPKSHGFRFSYMAVFEKAVITNGAKGPRICPADGEAQEPECGERDMYKVEMKYFIQCIRAGKLTDVVPMESTKQSIETVFAEMESAKTGKVVTL